MNKFTVMFCAPVKGMEEWMKLPEAERKGQEQKMMSEWKAWTEKHAANIAGSGTALGTNMRVSAGSAVEQKNDMMLYMTFQGESREEVAKLLADHPHFGIPGGYIEVMAARPM